MPSLKHTHTYGRWVKRGNPKEWYYKCLDPNCTHTIAGSLVDGKESLCSYCLTGKVIMDWKQRQRKRACCLNCQNTKEGREYRATKSKASILMDIAIGKIAEGALETEVSSGELERNLEKDIKEIEQLGVEKLRREIFADDLPTENKNETLDDMINRVEAPVNADHKENRENGVDKNA